MKHPFKKHSAALRGYICGFLSAAILLCATSFADSVYTNISVLFGQMKILINGEETDMENLVYNDRTYVPLRAYSELLGKSVQFDEKTNTISIADREDTLLMSKEIAFLVNGEAVRVSTFKQMINWYTYNMELSEMDAETYASFKEFVKQETIADYIVRQYATDAGIRIYGAEAEDLTSKINVYANNFGGMDSFVKKLDSIGVTYDFYYWLQETALLRDKLTEIMIDPVTDIDVINYYNKNISLYSTPLVTAKQIFFSTTDDTGYPLPQNRRQAKKQKADDVLHQLKYGDVSFDDLRAKYSEDTDYKDYPDGYTFKRGEMVTAFENAAFSLPVGEVSEVIESEIGYHIILVTDKYTEYTDFLAVKNSIYNALRNERYYKIAEPQIKNAYILLNPAIYDTL